MSRAILAVASIGAILTLSEVANAASFTVGDFTNDPDFTFTLQDKVFSDFSSTGSTVDPEDEITISFVGGVFQLNYSAALGINTALTTPGSLTYTVTIPSSFSNVFDLAGTNAQGSTFPGKTFGKTLAEANLTPTPLNFVSTGSTVFGTFAPVSVINVTSAWTLDDPDSFINGFSDQYTQNPADPTPIPEPSAVLSLAALGLAGVVGRSVSKSLHNKPQ